MMRVCTTPLWQQVNYFVIRFFYSYKKATNSVVVHFSVLDTNFTCQSYLC